LAKYSAAKRLTCKHVPDPEEVHTVVKHAAQLALQQAATAFNQGDLSRAESYCRRVLNEEPDAVDAVNLLSLVCKRKGDTAQAEQLMTQALEIDESRADIRANLGNLYVALRRPAEAETAYRHALRLQPAFRPARLGLARLMLANGRADDALDEAQILIDNDARDAEAWNVLGAAARALGRDRKAEESFRRALAIAPDYAVARHNLGALLASLSRSEEALDELDRAAGAGLRGPEITHNRASALIALGLFEEARTLLQRSLADMPQAVSLQMLMARLRYMQGDDDFASHLQEAVQAYPGATELRVALSQILRGAGRLDQAAPIMEEAYKEYPDDPRLLAEMSALLQDKGDYEQALVFAERVVAAAPGNPRFDELVIQALLSLGRGSDAMPLIEKARRRAPLDQFYIALEATAARLAGDPRYEQLYDYERFVQSYTLPVPPGWSSIEDFHAELIPVLRERHRFVAPPLDQSLRGGTQTPRGLTGDSHPVIRAFLAAINEPISDYCSRLGNDPDHPLSARNTGRTRLIGCWSVLLRREGFHVNHVHSEGWISSAYYVEVPREVEERDTQSGWIKFGEPKFEVPGATPEKLVQPAAGRLVLFPSYMWHGTTPIHGHEPRMTIAFDVVPADE
jgi:Flp pilus assembly protein TadD